MDVTAAARSETGAKIVQAAARLLQEHGPAAVTTRGVATAAGVQAPAIYRLFGDKDGLMDAVAEHVLATYVSAKASVVAEAVADDVDALVDLRAGWDAQMEFGLANPTLFALLSDPGRETRSPAALSGLQVLRARVHRVAQSGRLGVGEQRAVALIHAAGTGAVLTLLATPPEQRDPGLAEAMFEAVLKQILSDAPDSSDRGATAQVVAFRAIAPGLSALSSAERDLLVEWLDRAIDQPSAKVERA